MVPEPTESIQKVIKILWNFG